MHVVEIRCPGRELGPLMAKMRTWLDRHQAEPGLFEVAFLPAREIRFRLQFNDADAASAFARAFEGQMRREPSRATELAA
jgi:hypothetical protein